MLLSSNSSGRRRSNKTHMLYQLVRTAGGIPGPLAVLFDRTPVEVAEEKVPTLRVAPTRAARAREPSMVAERIGDLSEPREGERGEVLRREWEFLNTNGGRKEVAGRLDRFSRLLYEFLPCTK